MSRDDLVKDWRSTGRRRARKALFDANAEFKCVGYTDSNGKYHSCGKTTTRPPKDAPTNFNELWPAENRVLSPFSLQADHESKDLRNNSIEDLAWRCASCHKESDKQTAKGESTKTIDLGSLL